jgi:excisionase family DNA binding protein
MKKDCSMSFNRTLSQDGHSPGYMSLQTAAQWAGVSVRTLKRWINRGLPRYQAGPREKVLIRPADIEAFLTRRQVSGLNLNALVEDVLGNWSCRPKSRKIEAG